MRYYKFSGDNPMRDYLVGVDDAYDHVASKNIMNNAFGGGEELKNDMNLKLLGVIRHTGRGPIFVASSDEQLSPPTPISRDLRPR